MKVLVVGSGGREHCLAWKISQSALVDKIYCAPGNGGTASLGKNVPIAADDIEALAAFALLEKIDFTIVGPEVALVEGIVDIFSAKGLNIFGPCRALAQLEGSKVYAKQQMRKFGIPTADFEVFNSVQAAKAYIDKKNRPLVVKADGLAAGKGVIVCDNPSQAKEAVERMMLKKEFGKAGETIVIEERLEGEEVSALVFTDGTTIIPLVSSQDHKRVFDADTGPNTGGMGAYAPVPTLQGAQLDAVIAKVFVPLIEGLRKENKIYQGILYGGLMMQAGQPFVLEFNVRFGDPETQAILPKLRSDLLAVMLKTNQGKLQDVVLEWDERFCVCVVLASGGYPGKYEKGKVIEGLDRLDAGGNVFIFHAGTEKKEKLVTSGGRVLNVAALGDSLEEAQRNAYAAINHIHFENMFYRKDIGYKALARK